MTGTKPIQVELEAVRPIADGAADSAIVTDLHAQHGAALYDFARHLGLDDAEAADAAQEALLRLWRELRRGTHIEKPLGWTYRTCYHLAMGQHRWRRQVGRLLPRIAPSHSAYAGPETSDRVSVWAAVDELPPRQRHIVYLRYAADLPFDEIAVIVGISPSAARTHASRGLANLRLQLADEEAVP